MKFEGILTGNGGPGAVTGVLLHVPDYDTSACAQARRGNRQYLLPMLQKQV